MPKFQHNKIFPNDPFLCLVIGGSGKGKTHFVYELLTTENMLDYDNLYIYTNKPNIKYYHFLVHGFKNKLKKSALNLLLKIYEENEDIEDEKGSIPYQVDNIKSIVEYQAKHPDSIAGKSPKVTWSNKLNYKDIPKNKKTLVIFDDCINEGNQVLQKEIFTSGRGDGIGAIYITQSFSDLENLIKKNASCLVMFDLDNYDLQNINMRMNSGMESKNFKQFCNNIWEDDQYKHIYLNPNLPRKNRLLTDIIPKLNVKKKDHYDSDSDSDSDKEDFKN